MSATDTAGWRYLTYHGVRVRVDNGVLRLYQDGIFWRRRIAKFASYEWVEAIMNNHSVRLTVYDPPLSEDPSRRPEPVRCPPVVPTLSEIFESGPFQDREQGKATR